MRKLFVPTDPRDIESRYLPLDVRQLDRYTRRGFLGHRTRSAGLTRKIYQMQSALQILPPEELDILYSTKIAEGGQDEIKGRFNLEQSTISYHVTRSIERVHLWTQIQELCGETELREALYTAGCGEGTVQIVLGIVKTTSQSLTATVCGKTQGSARYVFLATLEKVRHGTKLAAELRDRVVALLELVGRNYNRLRAPKVQDRWAWKRNGADYYGHVGHPCA